MWRMDKHTEWEDLEGQSKMDEALFGDPLQWKFLKENEERTYARFNNYIGLQPSITKLM
jgi:hypothetical protein